MCLMALPSRLSAASTPTWGGLNLLRHSPQLWMCPKPLHLLSLAQAPLPSMEILLSSTRVPRVPFRIFFF